ncbi:MAG: SDR family NAD(P)-dependent oxidoreductase [Thermodesulfobacteriota bacterium]|jgi:3-oxoacyl-[acyl-carrier protein] reductase
MKFQGKVSVVTGGGAGIGEAIALAFAREGAHVAIWDLDGNRAEKVSSTIQEMGHKSIAIQMSVANAREVNASVQRVLREYGRIDILVNNAGICQVVPSVEEIKEEDWDRVLAVNLKGVFLCAKAVMGIMKKQKAGKIINMGSLAGKVGGIATGAHYAASKAAVMCLTKSLAKELGPYGVHVNAIAPGVIETDMTQMITGGDWQAYLSTIPLGRIGVVDEVAKVALFLASDEASYLTGEIIDVNGGQFMD